MILEVLERIYCIGFERTLIQDRKKLDSHNPVGDAWKSPTSIPRSRFITAFLPVEEKK